MQKNIRSLFRVVAVFSASVVEFSTCGAGIERVAFHLLRRDIFRDMLETFVKPQILFREFSDITFRDIHQFLNNLTVIGIFLKRSGERFTMCCKPAVDPDNRTEQCHYRDVVSFGITPEGRRRFAARNRQSEEIDEDAAVLMRVF